MSWTSRLLPQSLRFRLILSFGLLIFVSLFLAGTFTVYLLKAQQQNREEEQVGLLAESIALRSALLELAGNQPAELVVTLQNEYNEYAGLRILLLDTYRFVLADTAGEMRGTQVAYFPEDVGGATDVGLDDNPRYYKRRGPGDLLFFYSTPRGILATPRGIVPILFKPQFQTVIAIEERDISQAWRDLLPRLFLSGGVAFFVGVMAAGLLARSISQPLREITAASEEMAQGRYAQQIPERGTGEVGRLARAFNDMARQVNRSHHTLRDFLANVSHELKTPLTSIQGFSQAMVDGSLTQSADYAEAGRVINDEAIRMRGLVDDLLYLTQVDSGEFRIQPNDMSPNELLQATQERFERRAEQAGIQLRVEPASDLRFQGDGRRLEQALANIVDNAVRHTPTGGAVTIRSSNQNGRVQISVHNTGSVIPAEALPHIFERFFQADPAGASADANTGLGLAITKEIIEAHGGEVSATSSTQDGTQFLITLPATNEAPLPTDQSAWSRPDAGDA